MNPATLNAALLAALLFFTAGEALAAPLGLFGLDLPENAVPDRVSIVRRAGAMHGVNPCEINTPLLSVTQWSGFVYGVRLIDSTDRWSHGGAENIYIDGLGGHTHFRTATIDVSLKKGANTVLLLLSNEQGSNHDGWTFAFKATTHDGAVLVPRAAD